MNALRRHGDLVLLLAVVLAITVLHLVAFGDRWIADDAWFARALDDSSLVDFLKFRYLHWSGRIPIEMTLVSMVRHLWLWKLVNGLMWLLLCHSAGRIAFAGTGTPAARSTALAFVLFMLVSPEVVFNGAWWITGSINYLWPTALGLYGLLAFVEAPVEARLKRLGFLLASGLAMYNEQVALALLPATVLLWWARRAQDGASRWNLAQLLFMAVNAAVVFTAPGSHRRYLSEQALRFPDFGALDVVHKAAIGFGLVYDGILDPHNLLLLLVLVLVAALVVRSPAGRVSKALILAMLLYLALDYLQAFPALVQVLHRIYDAPAPDGATASSSRAYALSAWSAFAVACLFAGAVLAFWRSRREAIAVATALLLGLASLAALGFSPTAYASGWRVHFVCQIAFLLIGLRLIWQFKREFGPVAATSVVVAASTLAGYRVLALLHWL